MKGLKLRKLLSVAAVMSMLTVSMSCGKDSGESNYGFSSGEKAFEFFADAATECDGKKMIKCITYSLYRMIKHKTLKCNNIASLHHNRA